MKPSEALRHAHDALSHPTGTEWKDIVENKALPYVSAAIPIAEQMERVCEAAIDNACIEYPAALVQELEKLRQLQKGKK